MNILRKIMLPGTAYLNFVHRTTKNLFHQMELEICTYFADAKVNLYDDILSQLASTMKVHSSSSDEDTSKSSAQVRINTIYHQIKGIFSQILFVYFTV